MTFDPELDHIYLGTGNAGPYDPSTRSPGGGDNLYTSSIVALDADTGKYVWHYQAGLHTLHATGRAFSSWSA